MSPIQFIGLLLQILLGAAIAVGVQSVLYPSEGYAIAVGVSTVLIVIGNAIDFGHKRSNRGCWPGRTDIATTERRMT